MEPNSPQRVVSTPLKRTHDKFTADDNGECNNDGRRPRNVQRTDTHCDAPRSSAAILPSSVWQTLPLAIETHLLRFADHRDGIRFLRALGYRSTDARWDRVEINRLVDLIAFRTETNPKRRGIPLDVIVGPFQDGEAHDEPIVIPSSVVSCEIHDNQTAPIVFAPHSRLREFFMSDGFNRPGFRLPDGVLEVHLGASFNQSDFVLPDSVRHLFIETRWTRPLPLGPCSQLRCLELDNSDIFNVPCLDLPGSLTHLSFGPGFQSDFSFAAPPTLDVLRLGKTWNRPGLSMMLRGVRSIRVLILGRAYNQADFVVPSGVDELIMGTFFNQPLRFASPCTLSRLQMGYWFNPCDVLVPCTVRDLFVGESFNRPLVFEPGSQLERFVIDDDSKFDLPVCLPQSVTYVSLGDRFSNVITFAAPPQLDSFFMGGRFDRPGFKLSGTVRRFEMGGMYDQSDFVVPEGTEVFGMGHQFNQPHLRLLRSVRAFDMGDRFNHSFWVEDGSVLETFTMGERFNVPVTLPHTVTSLTLGPRFKSLLKVGNLVIYTQR